MKKRSWHQRSKGPSDLKRVFFHTLIGYGGFVLVLMLAVYIWDKDFFYTFATWSLVAPVILTVLSIPILILIVTWFYILHGSPFGRAAAVWIREGKAYVPVLAEPKTGVFVEITPVYVSDLGQEELIASLEKAIAAGHQHEPDEAKDLSQDPLLEAAAISSRSEFDVGFIIRWTSKEALLDVVDGRLKLGNRKQQKFPQNVSVNEIVEAILERLQDRA